MWSIIVLVGVLSAPPPSSYLIVDDMRAALDMLRQQPKLDAALTQGDLARMLVAEGGTREDLRALLDSWVALAPRRFEVAADPAGAAWLGARLLEQPAERNGGQLTMRLTGAGCDVVEAWAELSQEVMGEAPGWRCGRQALLHFGPPLPRVAPSSKAMVQGRWDTGDGPLTFTLSRANGALTLDGHMPSSLRATLPAPPPAADFVLYDDTLNLARRLAHSPFGDNPILMHVRGGMVALRNRAPRQVDIGAGDPIALPLPEFIIAVGSPDPTLVRKGLFNLFPGVFHKTDLGLGLPTWRIELADMLSAEQFNIGSTLHVVEGPGWVAFGADPAWTQAALTASLPADHRFIFRSAGDGLTKVAADLRLSAWRVGSELPWIDADTGMLTTRSDVSRIFKIDTRMHEAGAARRLTGTIRWVEQPFSPTVESRWSPEVMRDWLTRYCQARPWAVGAPADVTLPTLKPGPVFGSGPYIAVTAASLFKIGRVQASQPAEPLTVIREQWPGHLRHGRRLIVLADEDASTQAIEGMLAEATSMGFTSAVITAVGSRPPAPTVPLPAFAAQLESANDHDEYMALAGPPVARCRASRPLLSVFNSAKCDRLLEVGVATLPWCADSQVDKILTLLPRPVGQGWTGHEVALNLNTARISSTHARWAEAAAALVKRGSIGLQ